MGPKTFPTHTFLVVYPQNQTPQYFAYGPHGRTSGQLERVFYKQDINVYKGNDTEHLKNAITVNPPKDMSEEDFDRKVIETAKSFGNNENFEYNIWPREDTEGNCNTSSSTILYKSGVSKSKLDEYREEIKGLVTGFGNIKAWTADEQEKEVERKRKSEDLYEKCSKTLTLHLGNFILLYLLPIVFSIIHTSVLYLVSTDMYEQYRFVLAFTYILISPLNVLSYYIGTIIKPINERKFDISIILAGSITFYICSILFPDYLFCGFWSDVLWIIICSAVTAGVNWLVIKVCQSCHNRFARMK